MLLTLAFVAGLAKACAPTVAPETLVSLTRVESRFETLAIGVSGTVRLKRPPRTLRQAVSLARRLIAAGRVVDLGIAQINSRNLKRLHLSLESAFDPCRNLAAAGALLTEGYRSAPRGLSPQTALRRALSLYNTGNAIKGLANGYVDRIEAAAALLSAAQGPGLPAARPHSPEASPAIAMEVASLPDPPERAPPPWDVFARARIDAAPLLVFTPPKG